MSSKATTPPQIRAATSLLLGVVGAAIGLLILSVLLDLSILDFETGTVFSNAWLKGPNRVLDGLSEVLSAVLGISLTVVAIVVQLASQRYPAKIVDVFMYDRLNITAFAFMAASCIYVVMATAMNVDGNLPFVAFTALLLAILNFAMLLPYFAHVFAFLEPTNLISQIQIRANAQLHRLAEGGDVLTTQESTASAFDRIADNCMAAIVQSDRNLAIHSLQTLETMMVDYLALKPSLPDAWFEVDEEFFGTLAQESILDLVKQRTWIEAKGLMEFERVLRRALDEMSEVVSQIARSTRAAGEAAIAREQWESVELTTRFFNTYIRHGLNRKNIRAVYNILYEYRLFAVALLETQPEMTQKVANHLVYYGRTANEMGLPFVTVTVAHDVRVICENAFGQPDADVRKLLEVFLRLDQPVDGKGEDVALIGVRKAQSMLGAFLLRHDEMELVDLIREDMQGERSDRLRFIRDEILAVKDRKFWEITDRGFNFDFSELEHHPSIIAFFEPMIGT